MKFLVLIGRICFSAIFLMSSFNHFRPGTVQYAAGAGVPSPELMVPLTGVLILIGGLSILLGFKARAGAWLIVAFLVPVTIVMHRFWGLTDPQMAMQQQIHFMKNLSMLGGALLLTWFGAGPLSLDSGRRRTVGSEIRVERETPQAVSGLRR